MNRGGPSAVLAADGLAIGYRQGYRQRTVGEGIGLALRAGEVLCLLGPNGSGKTTLFRTLLDLLAPLAGTVRVAGRPLPEWSRQALARKLAYVPQSQAMPFAYTIEELVLMGRAGHLPLFARPGERDRVLARQALAALGIEHLAERSCAEVSGGERQLALIARALAQEAEVLVLDEPTSSLDFGNQLRVLERIGALRAEGIAVLMATHQPEHAIRVADRIAFLKAGRIVRQGGPEIADARALAELYGADEKLVAAGLPVRALAPTTDRSSRSDRRARQ
jgi:iron complex transport system ATP-binding protein